jgi:phage-related protein
MVGVLERFRRRTSKPVRLATWEILAVLFSVSLAILIVHFLPNPPESPQASAVHLFQPFLRAIKRIFWGIFGFIGFVVERVWIVIKYMFLLIRSIPILGDVLQVIWWILTAPFRFVGWLLTAKDPLPNDACARDGSCAQLERELNELGAKLRRLETHFKDSE